MLSKTETPPSLEKIIFKGGRPVEFKVKSGESTSVFAYRVYPELTDLWTKEHCKPNENEFFELHERAKKLLDPLLITDEQYEVFYTLFGGLTHTQSYKLAKYTLCKDLLDRVVKTVKGPSANYEAYADAIRQLSKAFELKIDNEINAGKINKEQAGKLFNKLTELKELYLQNKSVPTTAESNYDKKQ